MVTFKILAGGYDAFIASYLFNVTSSTLTLLGKFPTEPAPSWITLNGAHPDVLYAVSETEKGTLQSFAIDAEQGSLSTAISTVSTGGDGPAFAAALSTGEVAVFNYGSGDGRIIPTSTSPLHFDHNSAPVIAFPKPSPKCHSHPHHAVEHNGKVYIADLGLNKIWRLKRAVPGHFNIEGFIHQPDRSGPRRVVIRDDRLFILHELNSTLSVHALLNDGSASEAIFTVSTIPPDPPANSSFAAAEILVSTPTPLFPVSYIYISNRNVNVQDTRGDTIAIFEHVNCEKADERLELVNQVYTGLNQPRGMMIGPAGPDGADEYLVAAGSVGTAGVVVFRRAEEGRNLQLVAQNTKVHTRTSFVWL